ncbi:MAG: hypothetical protein QOE65_971 [Solirubrobacteraceae bacterium]|nr:hypothetical protein [Solirubrobacteraceae bacterium]
MTPRRKSLVRAVLAAAAAALLAASPAPAAWTTPRTVALPPASQGVSSLVAATAGTGHTVAAWQQGTRTAPRLAYAVRSASGDFGAARLIPHTSRGETIPRVGVSASGAALIAYQEHLARGGFRVRVRSLSATGQLGAPRTLSAPGHRAVSPSVAVNPRGDALVTWRERGRSASAIYAVLREGGRFGARQRLTGRAEQGAVVALDPGGGGIVAWLQDRGDHSEIWASLRPPGDVPAPPVRLEALPSSHPVVAAGGGTVFAAWSRGGNDISVRSGDPRATLGPPQRFVRPATDLPTLAASPSGHAALGWTNAGYMDTPAAELAVRAPGGDFGPPAAVLPPPADSHLSSGAAAASDRGDAAFGWRGQGWNVAVAPPGAGAGPAVKLTTPDEEVGLGGLSLGLTDSGAAVAVWTSYLPASRREAVRAAYYAP